MSQKKFFLLLIGSLLLTAMVLYTMSFDAKMAAYIDISYYTVPAFSLLAIIIYYLTEFVERTPQRKILLHLVILNVMTKMLIAALVIVLYYRIRKPEDGIFVVPFIVVYVIFTIFETYFMSEQARSKKYR